MAYSCDICNKTKLKGRKITTIWGVKYKSIRHRKPNIRKVVLFENGVEKHFSVCTDCLKSIKANKIPGYESPKFTEEVAE